MLKEKFTKKNGYTRVGGISEFLDVSKPTVWRWVREKKIKAYKLSGGITVFSIAEVLEALGLTDEVA